MWSACLYCYIDRHAFHLTKQGLMTKGELIARMGRVVFLFASANSTLDAVVHHKPGSIQVFGLSLGLSWIALGTTWMAWDVFKVRHPRRSH